MAEGVSPPSTPPTPLPGADATNPIFNRSSLATIEGDLSRLDMQHGRGGGAKGEQSWAPQDAHVRIAAASLCAVVPCQRCTRA
jgi:hypothetical protein